MDRRLQPSLRCKSQRTRPLGFRAIKCSRERFIAQPRCRSARSGRSDQRIDRIVQGTGSSKTSPDELEPVFDTPFNLTTSVAIAHRVDQDDEQLQFGLGYDHNWILDNQTGELAKAAFVYEPTTGRIMEVWTTEPGLQFYGGNFLDGTLVGKRGIAYEHRSGFCLEAQHYPDSPNQPDFPNTILRPGETYTQVTEYRFLTDRN